MDKNELKDSIGFEKLTTEEKCRLCINCDVDGTCIAKREAPFDSFECENNEKFEPYEEQ